MLAKHSREHGFAEMCDFHSTAAVILDATRRAVAFLGSQKEAEPSIASTLAFIVHRASLTSVNVDLLAVLEDVSAKSFAAEAKVNELIEVLSASFSRTFSASFPIYRETRPLQSQSLCSHTTAGMKCPALSTT